VRLSEWRFYQLIAIQKGWAAMLVNSAEAASFRTVKRWGRPPCARSAGPRATVGQAGPYSRDTAC